MGYYLEGGDPYKYLRFWLSIGVRSENTCISSWKSINDEINKNYFEEIGNYKKNGLVFNKDYIFKKDGKDVISID